MLLPPPIPHPKAGIYFLLTLEQTTPKSVCTMESLRFFPFDRVPLFLFVTSESPYGFCWKQQRKRVQFPTDRLKKAKSLATQHSKDKIENKAIAELSEASLGVR